MIITNLNIAIGTIKGVTGKTNQELGDEIGISRETVRNIIKYNTFTEYLNAGTLSKLGNYLGMSVQDLIDLDSRESNKRSSKLLIKGVRKIIKDAL